MYFLYYIDLSSCKGSDNSIQSLHPILQFWGRYGDFCYHAFAVVGSKLYMFGGSDGRERCGYWSDDWCYYDFSSAVHSPTATPTTAILEEQKIKMGKPMKSRKNSPIAAVVGGYRICVFGTSIYDKGQAEKENPWWGPPNFEVLDTRDGSWTELPELVYKGNYRKCKLDRIRIRSHCVEGSCLIICTDIGIYGIKVDVENPKWVKMEGSGRIERPGVMSGRWVLVGKNVCSPFEVVVRWGEVKSRVFAFENKGCLSLRRHTGMGVLCSERDKNGVIICSVQGRVAPRQGDPLLVVNVVRSDSNLVEKWRGDEWKRIQSDKSSIFAMKSNMELMGIFQFTETVKTKRPTGYALEDKRRSKIARSD